MADALNLEGLEFLSHPDAAPRFTTKPPEWIATYLPRYCFAAADRTDSDCRGLAQLVRELHRDGFWQRLFPDWETCCQALFQRPAVWVEQVVEGVRVLHAQGHQGAITKQQALAAAAAQAQPLAPVEIGVEGGKAGPGRGNKTGDDVTRFPAESKGNSQAYLLRRLARDRPDVLERVKAGEFRSARAAAIEAGIIRPVPTVRLVDNPVKVAAAICSRTDQGQALAIARAIIAAAGDEQENPTTTQP